MSYSADHIDANFFIKSEDIIPAWRGLYRYLKKIMPIRRYEFIEAFEATSFEECMKECGFNVLSSKDNTWLPGASYDITGIKYTRKYCDMDFERNCLNAIALWVEDDSYIELKGADEKVWRYVFKEGTCKKVTPKISW